MDCGRRPHLSDLLVTLCMLLLLLLLPLQLPQPLGLRRHRHRPPRRWLPLQPQQVPSTRRGATAQVGAGAHGQLAPLPWPAAT